MSTPLWGTRLPCCCVILQRHVFLSAVLLYFLLLFLNISIRNKESRIRLNLELSLRRTRHNLEEQIPDRGPPEPELLLTLTPLGLVSSSVLSLLPGNASLFHRSAPISGRSAAYQRPTTALIDHSPVLDPSAEVRRSAGGLWVQLLPVFVRLSPRVYAPTSRQESEPSLRGSHVIHREETQTASSASNIII
ncbi:uncharacterized protein V6R79_020397 [Siganus canaliculatus]